MSVALLIPSDIPRLREIDQESNPIPWSTETFTKEFELNYSRVFGITPHDTLCGYMVLHHLIDETHIVNFAIAASYRRQGLGNQMLDFVFQDAQQNGIHLVTLEVRESNLNARGLYAKYGFQEMGRRPRYYSNNQETALIMTHFLK